MNSYRIAGLPGDGIGPECFEAALLVLRAVEQLYQLNLEIQPYSAGAEHFRKHGVALPKEVLQECLTADAVLLAAIGLPDVRRPDGTEVQPEMMMGLRRALGLYAAVRPVKLYPGVASPLNTASDGIDMVILRENLEGLFASFDGGCILNDSVASDTLIITREGTQRVVDFAFRLARSRNGRPSDGRRRVTCVDKANVFRSFAFFRKVFFEVAKGYADIESDAVYVDAMSLYMVTSPSQWDVLVMENQFGDILSDWELVSSEVWDWLRRPRLATGMLCSSPHTDPRRNWQARRPNDEQNPASLGVPCDPGYQRSRSHRAGEEAYGFNCRGFCGFQALHDA